MGYADEVLADTPVTYLKLDEVSGTPQDSSGNAFHADSTSGTLTYQQTGAYTDSKAIQVADGANHVLMNDRTAWDRTTWTVEFWIKTTFATASDRGVLCRSEGTGARHWDFHLSNPTVGKLSYRGWVSNTEHKIESTVSVNDGQWHHVVGTYDGSDLRLYIDAVADGSKAITGLNSDVASAIRVFRHSGVNAPPCTLDDFAYYSGALSATRIQAHYDAAQGGVPVGQTTETDTAQPVGRVKTAQVGQPATTDIAQPVAVGGIIAPVGQTTDTASAQPVAWAPKARLVGQPQTVDTAQQVTRPSPPVPVGQASETDTAQPVVAEVSLGQPVETDTAQPVYLVVQIDTWEDVQYDYGRTRDAETMVLDVDPPVVPPPQDLPALAKPTGLTAVAQAGTGLAAGTYTWRVCAYRHDVSQITEPSDPVTLTVASPDLRVKLTWNAVTGASGYVVFAAPGTTPADADYQEVGRT